MAHVVSINISKVKGTVKTPIEKGLFKIDHGLEGDAHAGNWHRQVSLLGMESINKAKLALTDNKNILIPGKFAENITTEGIILHELPVGTKLKIGDVLLEITQIGKECHLGCEIRTLIGDCVMPKEGIFAKVLKEGYIKPSDIIELE